MRNQNMRLLLLVTLLLLGATNMSLMADEPAIDYTQQVQPILRKYCVGCHDDSVKEGKLSLETYEKAMAGGSRGGAINAGHPDQSRLIRTLTGKAEPKMPPEGEAAPTAAEIAILEKWITEGAKGPSGADAGVMLVTPKIPLSAKVRESIQAMAIAPGGKQLAIARHGVVELLNVPATSDKRPEVASAFDAQWPVNALAFSRDGKLLVIGGGEPGLQGEIKVLGAGGELLHTLKGHRDNIYAVAIDAESKYVASGSYDQTILLWEIGKPAPVATLTGHNGPVFGLEFKLDGKLLASVSGDRTVKLWSIPSGERLDTLQESTKELYALALAPDGSRIYAGGVDNRIRAWSISPEAKEGTNKLLISQFAHEAPILRLAASHDGQFLVSTGEDYTVKVWDAATLTLRKSLGRQPEWASGVAITADNRSILIGGLDGAFKQFETPPATDNAFAKIAPLADSIAPKEIVAAPAEPTKTAEIEPNDAPGEAMPLQGAALIEGVIGGGDKKPDVDLYRIDLKQADQWVFETRAARIKSPLDTKLEVLDAEGNPIPRLVLRAVRDSELEFRGGTSDQRGFRLKFWEEIELDQYVYMNGEVAKMFMQRRGPDADSQFYPEGGARITYFGSSPRAHALGEPAYVVVPYPVGTEMPDNGLPTFPIFYENDDNSRDRGAGSDSKIIFEAPKDGGYLIRVTDVGGGGGADFKYELIARQPKPDFHPSFSLSNANLPAGGGREFTVAVTRDDEFSGPVNFVIENLPPGFFATTPIEIEPGHFEAKGALIAHPGAKTPSEETLKEIKIRASSAIAGKDISKDVAPPAKIEVGAPAKVQIFLEPLDAAQRWQNWPPPTDSTDLSFPQPYELMLERGKLVPFKLRVIRNGFDERIAFEIQNLPHGVIVDDIGLSGVLVREKELERTIYLATAKMTRPQRRLAHALAQIEGNLISMPIWVTAPPETELAGAPDSAKTASK
jgi:hypothetical protein